MPFNFNDVNTFLPIFSVVISLCVAIGGFAALRSGFFKQSSEIQDQTISALQARTTVLEKQVEDSAKEIARHRQQMKTIRIALERRGLHIEIDGDTVTIIDADGGRASTTRSSSNKGNMRPIKLTVETTEDSDAGEAS